MILEIENDPRPYAWGEVDAISALLGRPGSGQVEAELWLGAHRGSPSRIKNRDLVGGAHDLAEWIEREPESVLGKELAATLRLPFLLKVLAAGSSLSLQAHPKIAQARAGYDRENLAGMPLDDIGRNYRDPFHKPELIVAISERFDALCGFRSKAEARDIVATIAAIDDASPFAQPDLVGELDGRVDDSAGLDVAVEWLLRGGDVVTALVEHLVRLASYRGVTLEPLVSDALDTLLELADSYPGDPGVAVSLFVRRIRLRRGEALFLPAGNIHAYLYGVGIELMAASDNVLRGGLTRKHVDVDELLTVLDFKSDSTPRLDPDPVAPGILGFSPEAADFRLYRIALGETTDATVCIDGPAIVLSLDGRGFVQGQKSGVSFGCGTSWFVTPEESALSFTGYGEVFVATIGEGLLRS